MQKYVRVYKNIGILKIIVHILQERVWCEPKMILSPERHYGKTLKKTFTYREII